MSTFAQLRAAWNTWAATALSTVPMTWALDPQPLTLKLPVRIELDGPRSIENTGDRDYRRFVAADTDVQERITSHRTAVITVRAISRDHVNSPAELTLERVRVALRRSDLARILLAADCSIRRVGPSVRYPQTFQGRDESVAAFDVQIGWRFDDALASGPDTGTIEHVEMTAEVVSDTGTDTSTETLSR